MPIRWKIFRLICIVQILVASVNLLEALANLFLHLSFVSIVGLVLFVAIMLLCILGINLVNHNYPEEPVQDRQKKAFNRLFLLNFLFLAFLFGFVFREYREIRDFTIMTGKDFPDLPFSLFIMLIVYVWMLIFQLVILYGLYRLRLELFANFMKRKFEFENK